MNFSQKLLTAFKAAHGLPSDYKAALVLGITKQTVSRISNGKNEFSDDTIVKMAELMGFDPIETLAEKHLSTEQTPKMRIIWQQILENAHLAAIRASSGLQADKVA